MVISNKNRFAPDFFWGGGSSPPLPIPPGFTALLQTTILDELVGDLFE